MRRKIYVIVALVCVASVGMILLGGWIGCDRAIHPVPRPDKYTLEQFELPPPEKVYFPSRDGFRLAGWFLRGNNGATVVLVHGRSSSHAWMIPHANYLYRAGFSVLLFDLRYRGESSGDTSTLGAKEAWDVQAAVGYLKTRSEVDPTRIGVHGSSLGAVAAILAAAVTPEITGVLAESPFSDLHSVVDHAFEHPREGVGLPRFPFAPLTKFFCEVRLGIDFDDVDPTSVIDRISPHPVLLIDALEDDLLPADSVKLLYEAAREPKALWQLRAEHGKVWETAPKEYERRALAFWRQTFGLDHSDSPSIGIHPEANSHEGQ